MPRVPEQISRSYADSMAGCTPQEANALLAEWEYVAALYEHDWTEASAIDVRAFPQMKAKTDKLMEMKRRVDPDGRLWNAHAPHWLRTCATA